MTSDLLQKCETCPFRSVDRCRRSNRPIRAMAAAGVPCPLEIEPRKEREIGQYRRKPYLHANGPKFAPEPRPLPKLGLVTCFFNPTGYRRPRENYDRFIAGLDEFTKRHLWTIELAFDDDQFSIPESDRVIRVRGTRARHQLWQKERLLNLAAAQLPAEYEAIGWTDCDHVYLNPNWLKDTARLLECFAAVQMYSTLDRLGPNGEVQQEYSSWAAVHRGEKKRDRIGPGGAWAFRRELWPIQDYHILGGGDSMFLWSLQGRLDHPLLAQMSPGWLGHWAVDSVRCCGLAKGGIAATPGHVQHLYHGELGNRKYNSRWDYLFEHCYDPVTDIETDPENGLIRWTESALRKKAEMVRLVAEYFRERQEDGPQEQ